MIMMLLLCAWLWPQTVVNATYQHVVINEVLFDPPPDGADYVEIYNGNDQPLELDGLMLANRNGAGDISGRRPLPGLTVPPGGYSVITANARWLRSRYAVPDSAAVAELSSLPGFPNEAGTVLLLDRQDSVIDELHYSADWHYELLTGREGVALERINVDGATNDRNNWTSASAASGWGTPGRLNSQALDSAWQSDCVQLPKMFSPDNDGVDDVAELRLQLPPGSVVNASVYNLAGRKVRRLVRQQLTGTRAEYRWDGCDDRAAKLPMGAYVVQTEFFDMMGHTTTRRNVIVLARRQ